MAVKKLNHTQIERPLRAQARSEKPEARSHDDHHHDHHDHLAHLTRSRLRLAFFLTLFILAAEVGGGLFGNSLALLSDAGHVVTDLFALGLAWFAGAQAERPANKRNTFGYHRVGILAALTNAVTLIVIAVWITYEAIGRLMHPEPVHPLVMFISAGVGIAVNLLIVLGLRGEGQENLNVRGALLHAMGDVGASVGVIIAGAIILLTGWTLADPLLSVGIAALVAVSAIRLIRETIAILMEAAPRNVPVDKLADDIKGVRGVSGVHDLHVWNITSGVCALSCHVVVNDRDPATSEKPPMLDRISRMLLDKYHIHHTTIQIETRRSGVHRAKSTCDCDLPNCYLDRSCGG